LGRQGVKLTLAILFPGFGPSEIPHEGIQPNNTYASSSPIIDGQEPMMALARPTTQQVASILPTFFEALKVKTAGRQQIANP
jgi:hypothetical protein